MKKREAFAKLPSVDSILSNNNIKNLLDNYPRELILESIRDVIESKRQEIIRIKEDEVEKGILKQLFSIEFCSFLKKVLA